MFKRPMMPPRGAAPARPMGRPMPRPMPQKVPMAQQLQGGRPGMGMMAPMKGAAPLNPSSPPAGMQLNPNYAARAPGDGTRELRPTDQMFIPKGKGFKKGGEVPEPVVPPNKGGPNRRRGPRNVPAQSDMDKKMREAYGRFERSPENDSPGFKKGGKVSSASKRADGCAMKGKTKGKFV